MIIVKIAWKPDPFRPAYYTTTIEAGFMLWMKLRENPSVEYVKLLTPDGVVLDPTKGIASVHSHTFADFKL